MAMSPLADRDTPTDFVLEQNYPNPFNPGTSIKFEIPADGYVELTVYDVSGREVRTLAQRSFAAGPHAVPWDGRNSAGVEVSSGVYFYKLTVAGNTQLRKMVMIR